VNAKGKFLVAGVAAGTLFGIGLAIGMDLDVKISERPDLNHAWQVWAGMSLGAVRVEEVRVVQVDITET